MSQFATAATTVTLLRRTPQISNMNLRVQSVVDLFRDPLIHFPRDGALPLLHLAVRPRCHIGAGSHLLGAKCMCKMLSKTLSVPALLLPLLSLQSELNEEP